MDFSFSKKMLALQYAISFALIAVTVIGTFTGHDVTAIAALAGGSILVDGSTTAFYFWKARTENRAKYAQRFVRQFAETYGIEAAISLAETVFRDT